MLIPEDFNPQISIYGSFHSITTEVVDSNIVYFILAVSVL